MRSFRNGGKIQTAYLFSFGGLLAVSFIGVIFLYLSLLQNAKSYIFEEVGIDLGSGKLSLASITFSEITLAIESPGALLPDAFEIGSVECRLPIQFLWSPTLNKEVELYVDTFLVGIDPEFLRRSLNEDGALLLAEVSSWLSHFDLSSGKLQIQNMSIILDSYEVVHCALKAEIDVSLGSDSRLKITLENDDLEKELEFWSEGKGAKLGVDLKGNLNGRALCRLFTNTGFSGEKDVAAWSGVEFDYSGYARWFKDNREVYQAAVLGDIKDIQVFGPGFGCGIPRSVFALATKTGEGYQGYLNAESERLILADCSLNTDEVSVRLKPEVLEFVVSEGVTQLAGELARKEITNFKFNDRIMLKYTLNGGPSAKEPTALYDSIRAALTKEGLENTGEISIRPNMIRLSPLSYPIVSE